MMPVERSAWVRFYRLSLLAYPSAVRSANGLDMVELFASLLRDNRRQGRIKAALFAVRAVADSLASAWTAHREQRALRRARFAASSPSRVRFFRSSPMIGQDLKFTFRQLKRSPAFVLVTVLSLALGIGATSAIFSALNSLVLRSSVGVFQPERLVSVFTGSSGGRLHGGSSLVDFEEFRNQTPAFESAAAFTPDLLSLSTGQGPRTLFAESVSGDYFDVLKVRPHLGRTFLSDETRVGEAERVAVISYSLWEAEFGGDPDTIGRTILLNERPFTVVGVAPPGFVSRVLSLRADVWVPLGIAGMVTEEVLPDDLENRRARSFFTVARLAEGATLEQAQAQLDVIGNRLRAAYPSEWKGEKDQELRLTVTPGEGLPPQARGLAGAVILTLMFPVGLLHLLACFNVANMMMARAHQRQREMALRLALGSGRRRLVSQLLTESTVLAIMGGCAGIILAYFAGTQFNRLQVLGLPLPFAIELDGRVLLFAFATSVATGIVFGLLPGLRASRPDLVPVLKEDFGAGGVRLSRWSVRNLFVVAQVAASVVLLAGAMLFLRSQQNVGTIDVGFDPRNVAAARLNLSEGDLSPRDRLQRLQELKARLEATPGAEAVSLASSLPLSLVQSSAHIEIEGFESPRQELGYNIVTPNYFDLMRIRMAAGRSFQPGDSEASARVATVNEAFVSRFWPGQNPIGKNVLFGDSLQPTRIVGVVRDHKLRLYAEDPTPHLWLPLAQNASQGYMVALVRTSDSMGSVLAALAAESEALLGRPPLLPPAPVSEMISVSLLPNRLATSFLSLTGALALFLALVGLHGVVAFTVGLRMREMGIRLALGASRRGVLALVLRQGLSLMGLGLLIGLPLAAGLGGVVSHLLYGISPTDPFAILGVAAILTLTTLMASLIPALRAASVDPVRTLRFE